MTYPALTFIPPVAFIWMLLAQADQSAGWWERLINIGVAGVFLMWLMLRVERRLDRLIEASNLVAYTLSTAILALKHKDAAIEELAAKLQEQAKAALANASKTSPG